MRSFAVVAGFAVAANAYGYGYHAEVYNTTMTSATPSKPAEYSVASSSTPVEDYPVHSVSSMTPEHPVYTTKVVTGLTTVCPEPTTVTYGTKTYVVKTSTTIIDEDCEYTTTYPAKPTPTPAQPTHEAPSSMAPHESSMAPSYPASSMPPAPAVSSIMTHYAPPASQTPVATPPAHVPYPSAGNGTVPHPTAATPSSTKPATSEFTGAAAQAGVGLLAVVGAVAAFL